MKPILVETPRPACITDSDEFRYPEEAAEEESPLTLNEQRIEWLFDSWADAVECDTYDEWHTVHSEIYGAIQMLHAIGSLCLRGIDPREELNILRDEAFQHGIRCIREGKYEGEPA